MNDSRSAFEEVLYNQLIPEFCEDPERYCEATGFRKPSVLISEEDSRYFMLAWDAGLIQHLGRGLYRAPRSAASEQFFWTGRKPLERRSFTLWIEPIITVGGLARLHFDHAWPKQLIGTQSSDWAFDLVAFVSNCADEFIAGEIKKTRSEIDHLIALMSEFGRDPGLPVPIKSGKALNAYKKVAGLRARKAPLFWALGPDGYSKTFEVKYKPDGAVDLMPTDDRALRFPHHHVA
jgi:hypothetical protein